MTGAVVLAAGASSRMGSPKALLRLADGQTFIARICQVARTAGVDPVVVVLAPPHADSIRPRLQNVDIVVNPHPEQGMLSSIQVGVRHLVLPTQAALIWPVDIPQVRVETVQAIANATPRRLVVPYYRTRGGHPVRIPRGHFQELLSLDAAQGLRTLMRIHESEIERLQLDDPGILVDVDTPEAYEKLLR